MDQPPNDWTGRILHFLFGAVLGAPIGLCVWFWWNPAQAGGWVLIPAVAVILGLLGAVWGDRLWYGLGRIFRHWWLP
jgi:hypothetical protein